LDNSQICNPTQQSQCVSVVKSEGVEAATGKELELLLSSSEAQWDHTNLKKEFGQKKKSHDPKFSSE